ncbi:MAG TPA: phospholipase D-like domain-containing protein [Spirochaetota bacterium]|nr:phospholipase D-like domain-containing protein [Spirochaetota bacterium]
MHKAILAFLLVLSFSTITIPAGNWEVYFTDPGGTCSGCTTPEDALAGLLADCRSSFYGAFYDISAMRIITALIEAHRRGVDVKLVTDDENFSGPGITMLLDAGIAVVTDESPSLMHNKFAVIDRETIFTGSYNTTDNCGHKNNNNAVMFRSVELAEIYLVEFEEMFEGRIFGNKRETGPFAELTREYYADVNGIDVNVYFAPENNVERIILNRIRKAKSSVYFMCFSFTSDDIGELIISRHKEGIKVAGIFEKKGINNDYSEFTKMKIEGVPVETDSNIHVMHHKVIIIDGYRVITGSYNLSANANTKNDENIIIIDSREIAALYMKEFARLYKGKKIWE